MKGLFVTQTDPYQPKPVLRALREAQALAQDHWDVSFVSWILDRTPREWAHAEPYPVMRIFRPVPPIGTSIVKRGITYNRATDELVRALEREHPDLLIPHDLLVLRAAVKVKRRTGVPILYDCHENWPVLVAENSRIEAVLTAIQERRLSRWVDHLLIPCEPVAQKFRKWGVPTTVVFNARPSSEIDPAEREASRRALGYESDDFVVGYAGAMESGRGLEILLDAVARLPQSVKVLLVGGPEAYADRLRQEASRLGIRDRTRVEGYRSFRDLAPHYAAMDLGVILLDPRPNHWTALPNKLFDSMGHGVPVLVSNYPAMAGVVKEGPCGWTLDRLDPGSLATKLGEIRDSGEAPIRGRRGRLAFLEKYAWENQAETFSRIVRSLTGTT